MVGKIDNIIVEEMNEKSTMCVAEIKSRTPVKTGNLRMSERREDIKKSGTTYSVKVGADLNQAPYAPLIEDGGKNEAGGMYIGRHMINDSIEIYQGKLEEDVQNRIEREVFSG